MGTFIQFKGQTIESSFCISLIRKQFFNFASSNLDCRVAGSWLLSKSDWLEQMMNSRHVNREMYFSRFPPSIESLSKYLSVGPLGNENQVLFLVIDHFGNLHGHLGLKQDSDGNVEIDNVLRISSDFPGIMKIALNEVLMWGKDLGFSHYFLKVISTNTRAIKLYRDLGFTLRDRQFLKIESSSGGLINLIPTFETESNTIEELFIMEKVL